MRQVPRSLVPQVLKLVHDTPNNVHPEKDLTARQAMAQYYWPLNAKDISTYLDKCFFCASHKVTWNAPVPMLSYDVPSRTCRRVSLDILRGFTSTGSGNHHLLVVMNLFSRYCELVPII